MKKVLAFFFLFVICFLAKAQDSKSYYTLFKPDSLIQKPEFVGGNDFFNKYIMANQDVIGEYDVSGDNFELHILCYVEKNGALSHLKIINHKKCPECDSEAVRLLKWSPKWKPATYNGKAKRVKILINLNIKISQYPYEPPEQRFTKDGLKKTKMIYVTPQIEPVYPSGFNNLYLFINNKLLPYAKTIKYINGVYIVSFVVERTGKLSNFKVLRCPNDTAATQIVKILSKGSRWNPGTVQNVIVRSYYTLKITYPYKNN